MATITAAMVKELRETTGAGMMDCKTALKETDGDMNAAIDWLRSKGIAKAGKKAGRTAAEGLIGVESAGKHAAMVEVNSETDFVARNPDFQHFVREVTKTAINTDGSVEAITAASFPGGSETIADKVQNLVATIGENMTVRRGAKLEVKNGVVASYVHNVVTDGLGRIGVLVALESEGDTDKLMQLGRQVAMHVAAAAPVALTPEEVDPAIVEREKAVFTEQARESGKPDNIIEKMVEGRIRKFYEESVLSKQTFVIDNETPVETYIANSEKDVGAPIKLAAFERFVIGEGIEKEESDFAAEVAATAGKG